MTLRLLTASDVARILVISRAFAYEKMREMTPVRSGRIVRVTESALAAWVRRHQCASTDEETPGTGVTTTPKGGAFVSPRNARTAAQRKHSYADANGKLTVRRVYPATLPRTASKRR